MRFRDRFFTPRTAKAIMSWRILLGIGVGIALGFAGLPVAAAIGVGAALYAASVATAMPRPAARPAIDPFTLGEPWRQLVQGSQAAGRKLRTTIAGVADGPLNSRLQGIGEQLERGLEQAWLVARRGDEIDDTIRTLDPPALTSKLGTLEARAATNPTAETDAAIASVRSQIESADRLKAQRDATADQLRLTQVKLDELVARASEVKIGSADTDSYAHDVDDLVVQLEALRLAVEETRTQ